MRCYTQILPVVHQMQGWTVTNKMQQVLFCNLLRYTAFEWEQWLMRTVTPGTAHVLRLHHWNKVSNKYLIETRYVTTCTQEYKFKNYDSSTLLVADSGGVRGVQMHPLWQLVTAQVHQMIMQQWMQQQQPGTVTHSRINSLLISRRLTRPRVA